ncbi:MAG: hypothetical protein WAM94_11850 [Chromatiaceae bacterium]
MGPLTLRLLGRVHGATPDAVRAVASLPPYQVALWPDGWEHLPGGGILVRDTDTMAEARRWYELAERNRGATPMDRAMGLHGAFVPRALVSLSRHRFASEQAASVAMLLVAGNWIRQRRDQLLRSPGKALRERALTWSGSRNGEPLDGSSVQALLSELVALCVVERLIPNADYRVRVLRDNGFGVGGFRCILEVRLESYACRRVMDVLAAGLVPWNRAVSRDGRPHPLIGVEIRRPAR